MAKYDDIENKQPEEGAVDSAAVQKPTPEDGQAETARASGEGESPETQAGPDKEQTPLQQESVDETEMSLSSGPAAEASPKEEVAEGRQTPEKKIEEAGEAVKEAPLPKDGVLEATLRPEEATPADPGDEQAQGPVAEEEALPAAERAAEEAEKRQETEATQAAVPTEADAPPVEKALEEESAGETQPSPGADAPSVDLPAPAQAQQEAAEVPADKDVSASPPPKAAAEEGLGLVFAAAQEDASANGDKTPVPEVKAPDVDNSPPLKDAEVKRPYVSAAAPAADDERVAQGPPEGRQNDVAPKTETQPDVPAQGGTDTQLGQAPPVDERAPESVVLMAPATAAPKAKQKQAQRQRAGQTQVVPPQRKAKPRKPPKVKERSVVWLVILNMLKTAFVLFCIVAVIGSLAAVRVSEYMVESTANDDELLDLDIRRQNIAQTSYIMALNPDNPNAKEEGDYIPYQELTGPQEHRIWVALSEIPDNLKNAVIAIEDREFEVHRGVSIRRSAIALANEIFEFQDDTFGASTIDQQLVKNLTGDKVVTDDGGDALPGYQRKLREMFRAWGLNNRYSKDMILEAYLNTMGLSEMLAGVQAGAQQYFNKDVSELTLAECATIAGITKSPTEYSPYQNPEQCLERRDSVLYQMHLVGFINDEQYNEALAQPLGLRGKETQVEQEASSSVYNYFTDAVMEDLITQLNVERNMGREDALNYIYTSGLRIECTVDWELQRYLEDMYEHGYEEDGWFTNRIDSYGQAYVPTLTANVYDEEGNVIEQNLPQSSASIIDYDGALKAVAGGIGPKEGSLLQNRATQSPRQIGSTMKPIAAYSLGIDMGVIDYGSSIEDSPLARADVPTNWPRNFSFSYRRTGMPVVSAIAESTNTVAVKVGARVGEREMFDFMRDTLQIKHLVGPDDLPEKYDNQFDPAETNDMNLSSLVLGGMTQGITTYELAGAYMMFGNGGRFSTLHTYERVRDANGSVIMEPTITSVQAISPESAFIMNRMLSTVINGGAPGVYGTGTGFAPEGEIPSVGKSGTTSEDVDRLFVGLTPYYVTAVWWGYDYNYNDEHTLSRWSTGTGNIPGNVFKEVMEYAQRDFEYMSFPEQPEGVVQRSFCTLTGNLAGAGCPSAVGYYNINGRVPAVCTGHAAEPKEGEAASDAAAAAPAADPAAPPA